MARPRIFDSERCALNVYLHREQFDWLKACGKSPSAVIRELIDERKATRPPTERG